MRSVCCALSFVFAVSVARADCLLLIMPEDLWLWGKVHLTEACGVSLNGIEPTPYAETMIGVALTGTPKQIACAEDFVDREQKLNRFTRKVEEYNLRNLRR